MNDGAAQPGGGHADHQAPGLSDKDVEHLADLVYRLLREDIRLGRARGEQPPYAGSRTRTGAW